MPAKKGFEALTPDEVKAVLDGLDQESDRGLVLVAASMIDDILRLMLREHFLNNPDEKDFLSKILDNEGPLSTFSSRIRIAYALGFLTRELYNDLQILRNIRNQFAHGIKNLDLNADFVRDNLRNMKYCKNPFGIPGSFIDTNSPRLAFKLCVGIFLLALAHEAAKGTKPNNTPHGFTEMFMTRLSGTPGFDEVMESLERAKAHLNQHGSGETS